MKRRVFFKSVVLGTAGVLGGVTLLKAGTRLKSAARNFSFISMDVYVTDGGFDGDIEEIHSMVEDYANSVRVFNEWGEVQTTPVTTIEDDNGDLYVRIFNGDNTYNAFVIVEQFPNFYDEKQVNAFSGDVEFGPIAKVDGGTIGIVISNA